MNTETFFVTGNNTYNILEVLLDNEFLWDKAQYKCITLMVKPIK